MKKVCGNYQFIVSQQQPHSYFLCRYSNIFPLTAGVMLSFVSRRQCVGETLQEEGHFHLVLVCSPGGFLQYRQLPGSGACAALTASPLPSPVVGMVSPALGSCSTQQPETFLGNALGSFCSRVPMVRHPPVNSFAWHPNG